jgi:hypothetical protein
MLFYIILAVFVGLPVYLFLGKLMRLTIFDWLPRLIFWLINPEYRIGCQKIYEANDKNVINFLFKAIWPFTLSLLLIILGFVVIGRIGFLFLQFLKAWAKIIKFCWR